MDGSQVKGELFKAVLQQVKRKWGTDGLEALDILPENFRDEQWYDFSVMAAMLKDIKSRLGNNNPLTIYQIGFRTIKEERRWQEIFEAMDPANVFLGTERQEEHYRVGSQTAVPVGPKHVRVEYACKETEPAWFEFYRGRLQGVLESTGRTGVVHLMPQGEERDVRTYDIKWG